MLYLILLTFALFFLFWFGDFFLTIKVTKAIGYNIEVNPLLKLMLKYRGKFIYLFKLLEILAFFYLIFVLTKFNGLIPFNILLIFIFVYGLLTLNNAHIYYKTTNKESLAFRFIFFLLLVFTLLFVYLNYMIYSDLGIVYNALTETNDKYNQLYANCSKFNLTPQKILSPKLEQVLKDLNLSIRR